MISARSSSLVLDEENPINWDHPLNRGLQTAYRAVGGSAYYGGPTVRDLCGNRNVLKRGTMTGGAKWAGSMGRVAGLGSIDVTGTSDYVTATADSRFASRPMSVSIWLRANTTTPANFTGFCSAANGATWTQGWGMYWTGANKVRFWIEGYNVRFVDTAAMTASAWNQIVGTWDGSTISCYVNGILSGTPFAYSGTITSSNALTLGVVGTGPTFFAGWLDDFRIWNRALSDAEVAAVYQESLRGSPESLNWLGRRSYSFAAPAAGGVTYPQLERGIRGLNRGLCMGMRG